MVQSPVSLAARLPTYGASETLPRRSKDLTSLTPLQLYLPHPDLNHPPPNVALDLSGGNGFSPLLGIAPGPLLRIPRASSASPLHHRPGSIISSHAGTGTTRLANDVALSSEVCSHPRSLPVVVAAVVSRGRCRWNLNSHKIP